MILLTLGTNIIRTKRISKADAIGSLKTVIEAAGKEVDHDICDRLTGKAAVYIAGLLSK